MRKKPFLFLALLILSPISSSSLETCNRFWGFYGHQKINRTAIFTLPEEMFGFYKYHIQYLTENAVNPDKRRYAVDYEAPRHYIDLDVYGDSAAYKLPRYWFDAVDSLTEDTLQAYGIVPWHIQFVTIQLTNAFKEQDAQKILRLSSDLGHYIADANVPLHTTENYNGQKTDQYGIHGFWESRLPELYSSKYNFLTGKASYVNNTQLEAWEAIINANACLDSVFNFEKDLSNQLDQDAKYSFELRGNINLKVYSRSFSQAYHAMLSGQVERQMRKSISMVGSFWFTAWVNGGQPNLDRLKDGRQLSKDSISQMIKIPNPIRNHESGIE